MAVGETSGQATEGGPRKVVSSAAKRRDAGPVVDEAPVAPLVKDADPELEALLDEEETIARRLETDTEQGS